uniref:Uncharacterized protein n=1 Tax=Phlebotomus papatasi TaxID=29031 RepID=A0A1B0DK66_PHLPP
MPRESTVMTMYAVGGLLAIILATIHLFCLVFFCEYVFYYIVISQCSWPDIQKNDQNPPLKVMLLADTHLLGPYRGHWFDKLRREWQMYRSFQTAVELFRPEAVFILGDLFDEGKWVTDPEFSNYVERYQNLFSVPDSTKLFGIVGNHDIGFHYEARQRLTKRFEESFHTTGVSLLTLRDIHFVLVNSIAMEGDGCYLCSEAESQLRNISRIFRCSRNIGNCKDVPTLSSYSKPILLQHYPLYRESDRDCQEHDPIPLELYRERWEVLSQESSDLIGELISPRIAFSGHSHNYCRLTVTQAAWRKYPNPMNQGVIGTDVVDRKVVNGVLHTHRLVSSKWYFPKWAQKASVIASGHPYWLIYKE